VTRSTVITGLTAVLVVALLGAPTGAGAENSQSSPSGAGVTLPAVACPTTSAASGSREIWPTVPARVHLDINSGGTKVFNDLAFYVTAGLTVLAPRGWYCSGSSGSDVASLDVVPLTQVPCLSRVDGHCVGYGTSSERPESVSIDTLGNGTMVATLCTWQHFAATFCPLLSPPSAKPVSYPGESVLVLSRWVIAYEDPPGVHGHGPVSGAWDPDNGVVVYEPPEGSHGSPQPDYWIGGAVQADCTLPATQHSLCSVVLDNVVRTAHEEF
jgi:hypothetical protein